jgi:hypothetical protein
MSTGPDSALGLKWTNEDGAGGDEDGAAGSAVTDATVAEGDGDVGMRDAAEDGDVVSTRENASSAAVDETGGGALVTATDATVAEGDGGVMSTRENAAFQVVGQKSWTHPRPSASR